MERAENQDQPIAIEQKIKIGPSNTFIKAMKKAVDVLCVIFILIPIFVMVWFFLPVSDYRVGNYSVQMTLLLADIIPFFFALVWLAVRGAGKKSAASI